MSNIEFIEITNSAEHLLILDEFYEQVYIKNFIDPDELVSVSEIKDFLARKSEGWYGENNYHVLVAKQGSEIIGGSISDYFSDCKSAAIEFITVSEQHRGKKIGRLLLDKTISVLESDGELNLVVAEIENPEVYDRASVISPVDRAVIWKRYGFFRIDFDYIQPRLSDSQSPASFLWLIARSPDRRIKSSLVLDVLKSYFELAMGIEDAESTTEYIFAKNQFSSREYVELLEII